MKIPDIEKLRRFSLTMALILLTYAFAGISLEPNAQIVVLGIPFKVSRPELLPTGLIIAAIYGIIRYYYYGLMLLRSPYRVRRDIIDGLDVCGPDFVSGSKVNIYFGPSEFETSPWHNVRSEVEKYADNFPDAFPKFARARASAKIISEERVNEDGDLYRSYAVKVMIPARCRIAALFQDIDYTSPIWLNMLAVSSVSWQYFCS